ncbi:hypothetical protein Pcac1_g29116 [Phytophthora cactorum]|nr:hypothetical protein Pcac1_g29116 [Phytophthora cactorum]
MKRKEQGGGVDGAVHGQGQAFMTSGNGKYKGRQAQKTSSACHYCGEHGHWIAKCSGAGSARTRSAEGRNERTSRRVKTTLATSSFRVGATRMSPSQVVCGWSTRVRRST